ncbi:hypothetical protein KBB68_02420 [Candidatus Babeliales bacterium]|nr:hypothetical protein [Candidatus Babeliales bacterium]
MNILKNSIICSVIFFCLNNILIAKHEQDLNRQKTHQEIARLQKLNDIDQENIHQHLHRVLNKLDDIDNEFKNNCDQIIGIYQHKNHEILNTINSLTASKKQIFSLKTAAKHLPNFETSQPQPRKNPEIAPMPKNSNSVILSESKETLANNPILDKIIERHETDLQKMKRNNPDYSLLKQELVYLKQARNLRDIQGTSIQN